jgi:NTE family protein
VRHCARDRLSAHQSWRYRLSGFPAYLGVSFEAGNVWQTRDEVAYGDLEAAGSLFLGAESPFGPVYLAAGFSEGGAAAFYLLLGRTF